MAQLVKNLPARQETWVRSLGWEDPLEKGKATHSGLENSVDFHSLTQHSIKGFSSGSVVKNPPAKQETKFQFLDEGNPLEEGMATHSSVLASKSPWREEPRGL